MFESVTSTAHPAIGDFTWHRLAKPRLTPGQIADKGRRSVRQLQAWGVTIPQGCRLLRSISRLEEHRDNPDLLRKVDERTRVLMGEAARTVLELYVATHGSAVTPDSSVLEKFTQAILGADLPESEDAHSARDIQFELYLWGFLRAGGRSCWFQEPPDLACKYGAECVGIAAKRIWALDQARKRLSIGAEQIARSGLRGFIAVNAQEYLSADAGLPNLTAKADAFSEAVKRLHGHLPGLATKRHVLGLLVAGTIYRWDFSPDGTVSFELTGYHQWLFMTEPGEEQRIALQFGADQEAGFAHWAKLNF